MNQKSEYSAKIGRTEYTLTVTPHQFHRIDRTEGSGKLTTMFIPYELLEQWLNDRVAERVRVALSKL
jgi:hypothetical protein